MDMEITALRPRRRFNVEDYYRMAEAGILGEDDRVELIEGEIVEMPPIGSPHGGGVKALNRLFSRLVGDRAIVSVQDPVRLSDISEPNRCRTSACSALARISTEILIPGPPMCSSSSRWRTPPQLSTGG
jgi:Uma2 family endonuclease